MKSDGIGRVERELLLLTFRSKDGVTIGRAIASIGLSIGQAAVAFRRLRNVGFVHQRQGLLLITDRGRSWLLDNQSTFSFSGEREWRKVPERFLADRIQPFEPYIPRMSKLNKWRFQLGRSERG